MPRGGRRKGRQGAQYPNRTDLQLGERQQPVMRPPSERYGQQAELVRQQQALPVINENDSVATEEIRFGDNDRLAARVAQAAWARVSIDERARILHRLHDIVLDRQAVVHDLDEEAVLAEDVAADLTTHALQHVARKVATARQPVAVAQTHHGLQQQREVHRDLATPRIRRLRAAEADLHHLRPSADLRAAVRSDAVFAEHGGGLELRERQVGVQTAQVVQAQVT